MGASHLQGMEKVRIGLKALTESLPALPIGSELSNEIMAAVGKIGKHLPQGGGGDVQGLVQQLAMMARNAKAEPAQAAALQGMMKPGGAPGGAPPPPPPSGAPPPMMGA